MTVEELKHKLLKHYENNPDTYKGACVVCRELSVPKKFHGHNYYGVHELLQELTEDGRLEQKKGKGFRLKK